MPPAKKTVLYQGKQVLGTVVPVENQVENFNSYNLSDGTQIRLKSVVLEVLRIDGEYDAENNPVYLLKSQNIAITNAPDALRKPKGG